MRPDYRAPLNPLFRVAVWVFFVALVLGFWGCVGYVAWHFISKFW